MPDFFLPEALVTELVKGVAAYVSEQRSTFYAKAQSLAERDRQALAAFFPLDVLDAVRVVHGRPPEPSFYARLKAMGIRNAPPFSGMAGITFQDVVVHSSKLTRSLLFHELVHAVQYKHLGVPRFANLCVRGFLSGGSYEEIPLEKQAYELEGRFEANSGAAFSVDDDVKDRIRKNRF